MHLRCDPGARRGCARVRACLPPLAGANPVHPTLPTTHSTHPPTHPRARGALTPATHTHTHTRVRSPPSLRRALRAPPSWPQRRDCRLCCSWAPPWTTRWRGCPLAAPSCARCCRRAGWCCRCCCRCCRCCRVLLLLLECAHPPTNPPMRARRRATCGGWASCQWRTTTVRRCEAKAGAIRNPRGYFLLPRPCLARCNATISSRERGSAGGRRREGCGGRREVHSPGAAPSWCLVFPLGPSRLPAKCTGQRLGELSDASLQRWRDVSPPISSSPRPCGSLVPPRRRPSASPAATPLFWYLRARWEAAPPRSPAAPAPCTWQTQGSGYRRGTCFCCEVRGRGAADRLVARCTQPDFSAASPLPRRPAPRPGPGECCGCRRGRGAQEPNGGAKRSWGRAGCSARAGCGAPAPPARARRRPPPPLSTPPHPLQRTLAPRRICPRSPSGPPTRTWGLW